MSSLKDRMYNHEVPPPARVWDKIAVDLSESELVSEFPHKLYNLETSPPPAVWEKIDKELNPAAAPVRKSVIRSFSPFLRYAAAAVLIGVIALVVVRLTAGSGAESNNSLQAEANRTDTAKPGSESSPAAAATPLTGVDSPDDDDRALEQSKTMLAKLEQPAKRIKRNTDAFLVNTRAAYSDFTEHELSQTIYAYEDHVPTIAERYMMLMTPDGNIIRMSKKWGELLCCVSGEEQDTGCKDQLKKWQEKIAASPIAPSPGNFMDILGLVNSLNESSGL